MTERWHLNVTPAEFAELRRLAHECGGPNGYFDEAAWVWGVSAIVQSAPPVYYEPIDVVVRRDVPAIPWWTKQVKRWATEADRATEGHPWP